MALARRTWNVISENKGIIAVVIAVVVLFFLYPSRQLDTAAKPENLVEITYMGPGGPIAGAMADAVKEFERASDLAHAKDPSKPVYRVISGQNAARDQVADPTRFLVSVAGGTPPDVIYFDRYAVAEWAARGAFLPLDTYIQRDLETNRPDTPLPERYYKPCWDEATYQGNVFGIPVSVDNRALLYNKDLLRRAGIVDEKGEAKPPRTWDELREYAQRLTEYDSRGRISTIGFAPNFGNSWLYMYGWMNDARFMSEDGSTVLLNEPAVVEALTYMKQIYDDAGGYEAVQAFQAGFQTGSLDPFIQGKVAMKIDGVWTVPNIASYGRDLNFGAAPPPRPANLADEPMSWCGGWALAIPTTAKNKDAAWELIRFLTSDRSYHIQMQSDRQVAEALGRVYLPPQLPVPALNEYSFKTFVEGNPDVPQKFQDAIRTYNELLPVSRFRPITPVGQLLWNEHINAMEAALYGRMPPQAALDRGATIVQRGLDRMMSPPPGEPIRSWNFFFIGYAILLLVVGIIIYQWDTRLGFRRRVANALRLSKHADTVVEGSSGSYFRKQWWGGYLCVSPWLIGFIVFGGGPMLFSLLISLSYYDILNPATFIGLENYELMFSDDRLVPIALWNTVYMAIGVPLGMAASLGVALLLNQELKGMAGWRTFFYLPAIVPMVAASILWIWILNPQGGAINLFIENVLGVEGPRWLQSATWSKPALIIMGLWGAGGGMIIWLAGLKGIPQSLYEAASVDGANTFQQFRHVTLPQLTPYIFFNLIMGLIGTFQIFGQAFIMTQGGPENSTLFYVYHLFNNAFRYGQMGYASAMAWVLFAIVLTLTAFQMRFARKWVHYGEEA